MELFILIVVPIVLYICWRIVSGRIDELDHRIGVAERDSSGATQIAQLTARVHALEQSAKEARAAERTATVREAPEVRALKVAPAATPSPAEVERPVPPPLPEPAPVPQPETPLPPEVPVVAVEATPPPLPAEMPVLEHEAVEPVLPPEVPVLAREAVPPPLPLDMPVLAHEPAEPVLPPEVPVLAREAAPPPMPPEVSALEHEPAELIQPSVVPAFITKPAPPVQPREAPAFARPAAAPAFQEHMLERTSAREWEAIIGGNWLNKAGVFMLVVGVALLLGYSFTKMGPAGHAALGVAVSAAMLGVGVFCERREQYRVFGRGLLGGGWAALYFTTYAMQALDTARVIHDPWLGGLLLLAVATGMIVHSLRYRSQTVTGLAYFIAFATLAITQVTVLSVIALVPLAASLLYLAHRFSWSVMPLFGLIATYGTCASRGDSGAPLWQAQALFTVYWLLFEGFDLLRVARRSEYTPWEIAIMPLNALAFTGLSYAKWSAAAPAQLDVLAAGIGAAYLLSTILRTRLRPPSSFAPEVTSVERALSGGYEGTVTMTAILSTAAVFLKFHGAWANLGLVVEAEVLFLAGLVFRESYPRRLAAALFAGGLGKLLAVDMSDGGIVSISGWPVKWWTPVTALTSALFYLNRALRSADKFYGYAASAVFAFILGFETPQRYLGGAWLVLAAMLYTFGWLRRLTDFRLQGYIAGALGLGGTGVYQFNVIAGSAEPLRHPWISLTGTAVLSYAAALCGLRSSEDRLHLWERKGLRLFGTWAATAVLVTLSWRMLPDEYLGLAWMLLALPLLELGLRDLPSEFRVQSYVVAAFGVVRMLFWDIARVGNGGPLYQRLLILWAALAAYTMAARIYKAKQDAIPAGERSRVFSVSSAIGTLFLLIALWALLPDDYLGLAWMVLALPLLELGLRGPAEFRAHSYLVAALGVVRVLFWDIAWVAHGGPLYKRLLIPWAALVAYTMAARIYRARQDALPAGERAGVFSVSSAVGTLFLLIAAWALLPDEYLGLAWMVLALPLLELGLRGPSEFRLHAYLVAALGVGRVFYWGIVPVSNTGPLYQRLLILWSAPVAYAMAARIYGARHDALPAGERAKAFSAGSAIGTSFLLTALWALLPTAAIGPAWAAVALLLLEAGFALEAPSLRLQGHLAGGAAFGRLFLVNFTSLSRVGPVSARLLTVVPVLAAHYYQWSRQRAEDARLREWERPLGRLYLYTAAILAVALMRFELDRASAATGWAGLAVIFVYLGQRWANVDFRIQSYLAAALVFVQSWATGFYAPDAFSGMPGRIAACAFVVACLYGAQLMVPRQQASEPRFDRHARLFYSALATALLTVFLFHEVSGSMLTVAWSIEGVALLIAGFPLNDRVLRLSGLSLFLVCILKLFFYDLRHLETLSRIVSFIALGLILVSVSWMYTRFRDRIQRYL